MKTRVFLAALLSAVAAIAAGTGCGSRPLAPVDGGGTVADGGVGDASPDGHSCPTGKPLPTSPCFDCDPLPPGADAGCGAPLPTIYGWDGSGIPDGERFPEGCDVALPVESPYYPGGPQYCRCTSVQSMPPTWICPI